MAIRQQKLEQQLNSATPVLMKPPMMMNTITGPWLPQRPTPKPVVNGPSPRYDMNRVPKKAVGFFEDDAITVSPDKAKQSS